MAKKITQSQRILEYMETFGSITPLKAIRDLGILRLSARIYDLKEQGHSITSTMESAENRFGEKVWFKRYRLGGNDET